MLFHSDFIHYLIDNFLCNATTYLLTGTTPSPPFCSLSRNEWRAQYLWEELFNGLWSPFATANKRGLIAHVLCQHKQLVH